MFSTEDISFFYSVLEDIAIVVISMLMITIANVCKTVYVAFFLLLLLLLHFV